MSLTLWCLPSGKTPQAKVLGAWFHSSFEHHAVILQDASGHVTHISDQFIAYTGNTDLAILLNRDTFEPDAMVFAFKADSTSKSTWGMVLFIVRGLLRRPSLSGTPTVTFCWVHIHNVVAKKRDASTDLLQFLHAKMLEHNVDFIGGDFNMSAFSTVSDVFSDLEFSAPGHSCLWGLGALDEQHRACARAGVIATLQCVTVSSLSTNGTRATTEVRGARRARVCKREGLPMQRKAAGTQEGERHHGQKSVTSTTTKSTYAFPTSDIGNRTTQRGPDRGAPVNLLGTALPPQRETLHMGALLEARQQSLQAAMLALCAIAPAARRGDISSRVTATVIPVWLGLPTKGDSRTNLLTRQVDRGKCEATEAAMVSAVKERPCGQRSISSSLLPLVLVNE